MEGEIRALWLSLCMAFVLTARGQVIGFGPGGTGQLGTSRFGGGQGISTLGFPGTIGGLPENSGGGLSLGNPSGTVLPLVPAGGAVPTGGSPDCSTVPFCVDCQSGSNGNVECLVCVAGYVPANGACAACSQIPRCTACRIDLVAGLQCTDCESGFELSNEACQEVAAAVEATPVGTPVTEETPASQNPEPETSSIDCESFINDCETCARNSNGVVECTACEKGRYLDDSDPTASDACKLCGSGCETCAKDSFGVRCQTCEDDKQLNERFECVSCSGLDAQCSKCGIVNGKLQCDQCLDGFGLITNNDPITCEPCSNGCKSCDDRASPGTLVCSECFTGNRPPSGRRLQNGGPPECIPI